MPAPKGQIFAKVSRNAERFWISDIEEVSPNKFRGIVANHVFMQIDVKHGDLITFDDDEVTEVKSFATAAKLKLVASRTDNASA